MPTFSAMQLDRFLEPGQTTQMESLKKRNAKVLEGSIPTVERRETTSFQLDDRKLLSSRSSVDIPPPYPRRRNSVSVSPQLNDNNSNNNINHENVAVRLQMSPALYTTPESTPIPVSPTPSFPPSSPFLINHKRRGPRLAKSLSEQIVVTSSGKTVVDEIARTRSFPEENLVVERNENVVHEVNGGVSVGAVEEGEGKTVGGTSWEREGGKSEDFFDPQESLSFSSSVDVEGFVGERSSKASTEYYDACEELSSDSGLQGAQRTLNDVEIELREMRLTLVMEIEKRKQVEETVQSMRGQWKMLREKLGGAGVVLPADLSVLVDIESDESCTEDICQQIHLARFVSESIGRGIARAEVEADMEAQLEAKNFEIARLCDRLRYYETMNREMSHRNQEAVELARLDRQMRRRRQKWVWGSIVTAITLGSAALAWSYLPGGEGSSSTIYPEASESNSDMQ